MDIKLNSDKSHLPRNIFAIICGAISGFFLHLACGAGIQYHFLEDMDKGILEGLLWGEHWFVRTLVVVLCCFWAGFIAGLIGRHKGSLIGSISIAPCIISWLLLFYISLTGHVPILNTHIHISIGNNIAMLLAILLAIPMGSYGGKVGEEESYDLACHFDSRPNTLLGIKWYHYLWIPFVLHPIVMQASYIGLYFLFLYKELFRSGFMLSITFIFVMLIYGTLYLMGIGLWKAYRALAGLEEYTSKGAIAVNVMKYAIGLQIVAVICQQIVLYLNNLLVKWLA